MGVKKTTGCPSEMVLEGFYDERLDDEKRRQVSEHLEHCRGCSRRVDALARISAVLRQAAELPVPPVDISRVTRRLFAGNRRRARYLRPLAAAGVAVLLLVVLLWPRNRTPSPAPAVTPPAVSPAVASAGTPALVEKMSGRVQGVEWLEPRLVVPTGRRVELADGALLSVWLNEHCQVLLRGPARASFSPGGAATLVQLSSGRLLARLRGPLAVPFVVSTVAGRVRATGTAFSVEVVENDAVRVEMSSGSVLLEPAQLPSATTTLRAPACARLTTRQLASCACSGLVGEMLHQAGDGGALLGRQRPGWLTVDSDVAGAMVEIDGRMQGLVPLTVALSPGPIELSVRSGMLYRHRQIEIAAGQLVQASISLLGREGFATKEGGAPARAVSATSSSQPRSIAGVERIRHLLARREYAQADGLLERLLRKHPDDMRAWLLRADSLRLQGQSRQALETYEQVVKRTADVHLAEAALFQQGLLLLEKLHRPKRARDAFSRLLERFPAGLLREDALYRLVECQLRLGDYPAALQAARNYLRQYPQGLKSKELKQVIDRLSGREEKQEY